MTTARRYGLGPFLYALISTVALASPGQTGAVAEEPFVARTEVPLSSGSAVDAGTSPEAGILVAQQNENPEGAQVEPPAAAAAASEGAAETPVAPAAKKAAEKPKYASIEEELAPQPKLGPRTLYDISPEARAVRSKELLANSNRPMAPVPDEVKKMLHQSGMAMSPMSLRDIFNWMTWKIKAKKGVKYEDVIESMDLKANSLNFKKVGHNQIWKDVGAITGEPTTRVEVLSYCDAVVGRKMMDISPEFSVWIPCRITVYEDYNGDIWLMTLDWDVSWLQYAAHPDSQIGKELYEDGVRIRDVMTQIMRAGAEGAW